MREHKMKAWDAGQDLIAVYDLLGEKMAEAKKGGFTEHERILRRAQIGIARFFNRNHPTHGFQLRTGPQKRRT